MTNMRRSFIGVVVAKLLLVSSVSLAQVTFGLSGRLDSLNIIPQADPTLAWTRTVDVYNQHLFEVDSYCFGCVDILIEATQTVRVGIQFGEVCPNPVATFYYGGAGQNSVGLGYVFAQIQSQVVGGTGWVGPFWEEEDCDEEVHYSDPPGGQYTCGPVS